MTRKHFEAIARTISSAVDASPSPLATNVIRNMAEALARDFASFNPLFDEARFLKACGL
jgi:hypothetical protein